MAAGIACTCPEVQTEVRGALACITLNRPRALNALSLPMIRAMSAALQAWRDDPAIAAVAVRGMGKEGPFGAFCAGGDIRFFHQAMLRGDGELEDFFTEEYELNHLIHHYPKPYIAFMDGIVMGGGMGISQGAALRIVTPRTRMAMPETNIGLFPDVGGGWFLARCPKRAGEWLALTSEVIHAGDALAINLADDCFDAARIVEAWDRLAGLASYDADALSAWRASMRVEAPAATLPIDTLEACFDAPNVAEVARRLEQTAGEWAAAALQALRTHSPLMLEVTLRLIRRGAGMNLGDELRLERDMVRHCFNTRHLDRFMTATETMEGIRALVVDKDRQPRWNPATLAEVTPQMIDGFFASPWPVAAHPLRHLA